MTEPREKIENIANEIRGLDVDLRLCRAEDFTKIIAAAFVLAGQGEALREAISLVTSRHSQP